MSDEPHGATGAKPPSRRKTLAQRRTSLARQRTRFAADRTLMAWVRTALALISFGFSFVKFFQYLAKTSAARAPWSEHGPRNVGLTLVGLGTVMVLLAALQNYRFGKQLGPPGGPGPQIPGALIVALVVGAMGLLALVDLIFRVGKF